MERCAAMNCTGRAMPQYGSRSCRQKSPDRWDNWGDEFPIGMGYVPWQRWRDLYEPAKALQVGTIFAELDKPFLGMRGVKR